jgi:FkbM family methyltransferase
MNLEQNNATNITIVPKALTANTGRVDLILTPDSHNHYVARPFKDDGQKIRVASISFSDLCHSFHLSSVDLLKMDIEGGEYAVFEKMTSADFEKIQAIILEYHSTKLKNYTIIEKKLRENGFGVEIFPSQFDKTMGFLWAKNKKKKSS